MSAVAKVLEGMEPPDLLKSFKAIRKEYRQRIRDGKEQLNPAGLRQLDADIEELEQMMKGT